MVRSADALCALLGSAAGNGQQVDIWRSLQSLTLDVVGRTAFGVDFNTLAAAPKADSQDAAEAAAATEPAAAGKAGLPCHSLRSSSTDALLRAVRAVFEVCGPAQPLFGLCFVFPEVSDHACASGTAQRSKGRLAVTRPAHKVNASSRRCICNAP